MLKKFALLLALLVLLPSLSNAQTTAPTTQPKKTIRLLTVGNSFADNATAYVVQIAAAGGNQVILGKANTAGCPFEKHWRAVEASINNPDNPAAKIYPNLTAANRFSLAERLESDRWDVITVQQFSGQSDVEASFYPWADKLIEFIKQQAPQAEVVVHQTWAYRADHARFKGGKSTQEIMYKTARANYHKLAQKHGLRVIPTGDAMFAADNHPAYSALPSEPIDLSQYSHPQLPPATPTVHATHRWEKTSTGGQRLISDLTHANQLGCYLASCVWYEFLFNESCVGNTFAPKNMKEEDIKLLQQLAHDAVEKAKLEPAAVAP